MAGQRVVYPYSGVLHSIEKEQIVDAHNNLDGSRELSCYAQWKQLLPKPILISFI